MRRIIFLCSLLGLFTGAVQAHDEYRHDREGMRGYTLPKPDPWVEGAVEIPAYPVAENLVEFTIPGSVAGPRFLLDKASISVGDDGVARYSIAIQSGEGARRYTFEGIRCKARQYRQYAYGVVGEKFRRHPKSQWRPIQQLGRSSYHGQLAEQLMCSGQGNPNKREQILEKLASWR